MDANFIDLNTENIDNEHICCAFSDKKCTEGYELKKQLLKEDFENGFVFRRINERAKVFIEYVPAEFARIPVNAPDYLMVQCFWVSGQYKGKGHAKTLLESAEDDARSKGKNGLVTVVGTKKFHFMSDTKWLLNHGFETCEKLSTGFSLLVKKLKPNAPNPSFCDSVKTGECENKDGLTAYYTNRCPFTEYYVNKELKETAAKRKLNLKIIKLETLNQAKLAPTPATIFSLFVNGKYATNDISACLDSRFDKIVKL